jgi:hypothetical protein
MPLETTADILRKARDHIAEPGMWYQGGDYSDKDSLYGALRGESCCPQGAIIWAEQSLNASMSAAHEALHISAGQAGYDSVSALNDNPDTTIEDILTLFDRAIAAEEANAT